MSGLLYMEQFARDPLGLNNVLAQIKHIICYVGLVIEIREVPVPLSNLMGHWTWYYAVILAACEAFLPFLLSITLITIWNVGQLGLIGGFLTSWMGASVGSASIFGIVRLGKRTSLVRKLVGVNGVAQVLRKVNEIGGIVLFMLIALPVTPAIVYNIAYGLSDYSDRRYILILLPAKFVMVFLLAEYGEWVVGTLRRPPVLIAVIIAGFVAYIILKRILKIIFHWIDQGICWDK